MGKGTSKDKKEMPIGPQVEIIKTTFTRMVGFENGAMIICKPAMVQISEDFMELIKLFGNNPDTDAICRSLKDIISHVCDLEESKRKGEDSESEQPAVVIRNINTQAESKATAIDHSQASTVEYQQLATDQAAVVKQNKIIQSEIKATAIDHSQASHVEYSQLATILEVVKQLPNTLRVVQNRISSAEVKDGSAFFTQYDLDDFIKELELDTVKVSSNNSITLPQNEVDTILQQCQKYLTVHEENAYNNNQCTDSTLQTQQSLSNNKPIGLKMNQTLEQSKEQLNIISSKRKRPFAYVQALEPLPSGATGNFFTALQVELEQREIKLEMTDVQSFNDDETGSNLVMVICNNHSRLQADVVNACKNIKRNRYQRILLAVIHCATERLLPSTLSSSKAELINDADLKNIPVVLDFAFDKDNTSGGIYECKFNKRAFEIIESLRERLMSAKSDARGSNHKKKNTTV